MSSQGLICTAACPDCVQNQYAKVMRVAELARAASKQSSSKLAKCKRELAAAQEEASLSKKAAGEGAGAVAAACVSAGHWRRGLRMWL